MVPPYCCRHFVFSIIGFQLNCKTLYYILVSFLFLRYKFTACIDFSISKLGNSSSLLIINVVFFLNRVFFRARPTISGSGLSLKNLMCRSLAEISEIYFNIVLRIRHDASNNILVKLRHFLIKEVAWQTKIELYSYYRFNIVINQRVNMELLVFMCATLLL